MPALLELLWVRERDAEDQLAAAAKTLLLQLDVPHDDRTVERDLVEAPGYPSAGSLIDALIRWGVSSGGASLDAADLGELALPCVMLDAQRRFVVVVAVEPGRSARIIDTRSGPADVDWEAFTRAWSGVAIAAEKNDGADASSAEGRAEEASRRRRRLAIVALASAALAALFALTISRRPFDPVVLGLTATKLAGLGVSLLLFLADSGDDSLVRRFCTLGKHASCATVLRSGAARLGPVSMTDLGVVYFSGSLLALLFSSLARPSDAAAMLWVIAVLSASSLPYTLFSLGYQARLRVFCPLCVTVQLLLWAELAIDVGRLRAMPELAVTTGAALALAALLPVLGWTVAKPVLLLARRQPALRRALARVRRDPTRIRALLAAAAPTALPPTPLEILEGDPGAPTTLTVYTDLLCHICASTHGQIVALAAQGGLRVRYRPFVYFPPEVESRSMARCLCEYVARGDNDAAGEALARWFARRAAGQDPDVAPMEGTEAGRALEQAYAAWATTLPYKVAPMIYIGDRLLPEEVLVPELHDFIAAQTEGAAADAANDDC